MTELHLLNNGYPAYQSINHKSQSILDFHFYSLAVFIYFDLFQVAEDFGSDHLAVQHLLHWSWNIKQKSI